MKESKGMTTGAIIFLAVLIMFAGCNLNIKSGGKEYHFEIKSILN